jgi:hypothetical protein
MPPLSSPCLAAAGVRPPVFETALAILAVWRVAQLVARERGPWDVCSRLHAWAWQRGLGDALACPHCVALWLASLPAVLLAADGRTGVLLWLAIAGGASVLERALPAWPAPHASTDLPESGDRP